MLLKTVFIVIVYLLLMQPLLRFIEALFAKTKTKSNQVPTSPFYLWKAEDLDQDVKYHWEAVFQARYAGRIAPVKKAAIKPCPKCLEAGKVRPSENLTWVFFRSPSWTWRNLCGREGFLSICTDHKRQVDFVITGMN